MDLRHFSPSQREVVQAEEGPLSILAGPGSGKTTVLAGRIAYLVEDRGIRPSCILAVTFTTAAAAAMRRRLLAVLGETAQELTITTFHALGLRIIKQWSDALGFDGAAPAVYGREDARAVLRESAARIGLELAGEDRKQASAWAVSLAALASAVERYRLGAPEPDNGSSIHDGFDPELLSQLSDAYERLLKERGAVDYPCMLTMPLRLFEKESGALRMFQDAYRFVMADEFQDTCHTQFDLLNQIVERHRNLAVVGDPRQTVFSFRSADPAMLLNFQNVYPEARVYPLDQNFRSTALIVALGNALAAPLNYGADGWTANNHGPKARVYCARDDIDEARFVANEIAKLVTNGTVEHPGQTAVLFRTNAQARILTLAMRAAGLPFRVRTDADLFVQSDVRDVVAYLRLAHCPTDAPALWRIVNVPPRRLRSIEQALRKEPVPVNALADWAQKRGGPPARHAVEDLLTLISDLHDATQNCLPANALETVLSKTALADWLARQENASTRLAHIAELRTVMSNSQAPDLATWLVDLHLGEADSSTEVGAPAVTLSTIHSAKGGEWPVVFVTGLEEGLLPHARSGHPGKTSAGEEEERRLAFVAVSRAQVLLYLVHCQTRSTGERDGPPLVRRPSRFLRSLPPELVEQVSGATR